MMPFSITPRHALAWAQALVVEAAPFCIPDDVRAQLPAHLPVLSRIRVTPPHYALALIDTYKLYALHPDCTQIAFLRSTDIAQLSHAHVERLLVAQWRAGRGQVYRWDQIAALAEQSLDQDLIRRMCVPTPDGRFLILDAALWRRLPGVAQEAWLAMIVREHLHPYPTLPASSLPTHRVLHPWLLNTFACSSGPNCFATTLAAAIPQGRVAHRVATRWLRQTPFLKGMAHQGYRIRPGLSPLNRAVEDSICLWVDAAENVQHACYVIGDGIALNKNAQSWYAPRHLAAVRDIVTYWAEDRLEMHLYTR